MTHWNHRVMRHQDSKTLECHYAIHEVYYTNDKVNTWSVSEMSPFGETADELKADIERFLKAFDRPVLDSESGKEI